MCLVSLRLRLHKQQQQQHITSAKHSFTHTPRILSTHARTHSFIHSLTHTNTTKLLIRFGMLSLHTHLSYGYVYIRSIPNHLIASLASFMVLFFCFRLKQQQQVWYDHGAEWWAIRVSTTHCYLVKLISWSYVHVFVSFLSSSLSVCVCAYFRGHVWECKWSNTIKLIHFFKMLLIAQFFSHLVL